MPSLMEDLQALLAVQEVDSRMDRARAQLAALDNGTQAAAAYNAAKAEADSLRAQATKALAEQHDSEMRLQSIEAKIAQSDKTLFSGTVTGARELEDLQKVGAMLRRQKDEAEERTLEAMEVGGEAVKTAETAEATLSRLTQEYRKIRAAFKERSAALTEEIAVFDAERKEAARHVSPALLARYSAIRSKKAGVGAAQFHVDDNSCGACRTRISGNLAEAVMALQTAQLCEYCGRILVPPPARQ